MLSDLAFALLLAALKAKRATITAVDRKGRAIATIFTRLSVFWDDVLAEREAVCKTEASSICGLNKLPLGALVADERDVDLCKANVQELMRVEARLKSMNSAIK